MQFYSQNQQKVCVLEWLKVKQFGRRCHCSGDVTGNKCCNWGVKKKYIFPGTLAKLRKLASILKYQLAFPSHLQNSLDGSWPLNTHKNVQFGCSEGQILFPGWRRCCSEGWRLLWRAQTINAGTPSAPQPPLQVLFVLFRSTFGHFWLVPLAQGMQTQLAGSQPRASSLTGREKSTALGLSHLGSVFSQTFSLKASSRLCPPFTCWVPTIPLWISLQC